MLRYFQRSCTYYTNSGLVICAHSAAHALKLLSNQPVDLMFSDVVMPEMDGYELAIIVNERYPNTKIILISGFNDERHVSKSHDILYKNLIHKPYCPHQVLKAIRDNLDEQNHLTD